MKTIYSFSSLVDKVETCATQDEVDGKLSLGGGTLTGRLDVTNAPINTTTGYQLNGKGVLRYGGNDLIFNHGTDSYAGNIIFEMKQQQNLIIRTTEGIYPVYSKKNPQPAPTANEIATEFTTAQTLDEDGNQVEHTVVTKTLMDTINELQAKIALLEVKVKTLEGI